MGVFLPFQRIQERVSKERIRWFSGCKEGFTLIELLIVLAILAIIFGFLLARYTRFGQQTNLETSAQQIINSLKLAQNKTLASENETVYGVHFESGKFVLFEGAAYDPSASTNEETILTGVEIYQISLNGGGNDVIFDRIRGTTDQSGTVGLRLTDDTSQIRVISINPLGQASLQESVSTLDTRITDTRHLHFDLGWSIQNATTLRFVFSDPPNPNVIKDIPMAGFFNNSKTVFDWSGTIDVNGSDQKLRIHTHLLDAINTNLSIHRDRRYNTKAVQILIQDTGIFKDIVSYTSSGTATVGVYGGTVSQQ